MRSFLFFLLIFSISQNSKTQTLIPNPGFELISNCPTSSGFPCPNTNQGSFEFVYNWFNPTCGSPEIYQTCSNSINPNIGVPNNFLGYQIPFQGGGYAGIFCADSTSTYCEYITSDLKTELTFGKEYCVLFYVSFTTENIGSFSGTDIFGAYFSQGNPDTTGSYWGGRIFQTGQVLNTPGNVINDSINWILIKGKFTATGGEDHITIGNFFPDSLVNGDGGYYYVDEVNVTECRPPVLGNDTTLLWGDGIFIGDTAADLASYSWSPTTDLSASNSYFTLARPNETTTYTLTKITACDTTSASITITVLTEEESFRVLPNINTGSFTLNYYHDKPLKLHIYNSIGQLVLNADLPEGRDISINYDLPQLADGNYIIRISNGERFVYKNKLIIIH